MGRKKQVPQVTAQAPTTPTWPPCDKINARCRGSKDEWCIWYLGEKVSCDRPLAEGAKEDDI